MSSQPQTPRHNRGPQPKAGGADRPRRASSARPDICLGQTLTRILGAEVAFLMGDPTWQIVHSK
jgi:hypothetical protein